MDRNRSQEQTPQTPGGPATPANPPVPGATTQAGNLAPLAAQAAPESLAGFVPPRGPETMDPERIFEMQADLERLSGKASSWDEVWEALRDIDPDMAMRGDTGLESVLSLVKELGAARDQVHQIRDLMSKDVPMPQPKEDDLGLLSYSYVRNLEYWGRANAYRAAGFQEQVESLGSRVQALERTIASNQNHVDGAIAVETERDSLRQELAILKDDRRFMAPNDVLEKRVDDWMGRATAAEDQLSTLKGDYDVLSEQLAEARGDADHSQREANKLARENDGLRENLQETERNLAKLQRAFVENESALGRLNGRMALIEADKGHLPQMPKPEDFDRPESFNASVREWGERMTNIASLLREELTAAFSERNEALSEARGAESRAAHLEAGINDALGRFQVTHVHAALRECLKEAPAGSPGLGHPETPQAKNVALGQDIERNRQVAWAVLWCGSASWAAEEVKTLLGERAQEVLDHQDKRVMLINNMRNTLHTIREDCLRGPHELGMSNHGVQDIANRIDKVLGPRTT